MIIDIIVLAVLLISAVIAFLRGFIREVLTILGVVGGLAAAYFGGPHFLPYMESWLGITEDGEPQHLFGVVPYTLLADILSYGSIFIVVVIFLSVVSHFLAEAVKSIGLGAIDRTFGVIFGLLRGAILLGVLYLPMYMLVEPEQKAEWFEGSKSYFYLEKTAAALVKFLPDSALKKMEEDAQTIGDAVTTREKLREIEVLQKEEQSGLNENRDEEKNSQGYSPEFRDKMNELFEQESETEQ